MRMTSEREMELIESEFKAYREAREERERKGEQEDFVRSVVFRTTVDPNNCDGPWEPPC